MRQIEELTRIISTLPGIGPRQARRLSYFLLLENKDIIPKISDVYSKLKDEQKTCTQCLALFFSQKSTECPICLDENRDSSLLMIVENDIDKESIEKSGIYKGLYFILGGSLPIMENKIEKYFNTETLSRVLTEHQNEITEIVIALSLTPEGDHTTGELKNFISDIHKEGSYKVSTLGRGLSTGTELEYSDIDTIKYAFSNRK